MIATWSCVGPSATFSIDKSEKELTAPATVHFTLKTETEDIDSVVWNFGDGTTSRELNPSHQYLHSGNYKISQTVYKGRKEGTFTQVIQVKPPKHCLVLISTDKGDMLIRLSDGTPLHRDNFLKLAEKGFYDSLLFHRVIPGFMIQGGDPSSRHSEKGEMLGSGGPGYTIPAEFRDSLIHIRGAVAAARTGDRVNPERRSSGSQFYIVDGRTYPEDKLMQILKQSPYDYSPSEIDAYEKLGGAPFLDGKYTVFGYVIDGFDVIDKIASANRDARNRPKQDIRMQVTVIK